MQKQYRLRWKSSDSKALQGAISKFNRRIRKLEKQNPELKGFLPDKASYGFYRDAINTRADLKREINTLNRFSRPGAEKLLDIGDKGTKITKWQLTESNRRVRGINARRQERLDLILNTPKTRESEPLDYIQAQFGLSNIQLLQFKPINVTTPGMTQVDVGKKWRTIVRQSSRDYYTQVDYRWRDNYIKSIEENFGSLGDDVVDKLKSMPIDEFIDKMYADTEAGIENNYVDNYSELVERLRQLYNIWGFDVDTGSVEDVLEQMFTDGS